MWSSDPAALHVQLQQDAGGGAVAAEAVAGAEQTSMLLGRKLETAAADHAKGTALVQCPCGRCLAQAEHCKILITRHLLQRLAAV